LSINELGEKPVVKVRYPHMMPEDTAIWRRFVKNGLYLPDKVWYDVHVGMPIDVSGEKEPWVQQYIDKATKKRIDVVGRTGQNWIIIEVKPRAGIVALGQAIFYTWAFLREVEILGEIQGAVVTDSADPDLVPLFDELGIVVFEVGRGD